MSNYEINALKARILVLGSAILDMTASALDEIDRIDQDIEVDLIDAHTRAPQASKRKENRNLETGNEVVPVAAAECPIDGNTVDTVPPLVESVSTALDAAPAYDRLERIIRSQAAAETVGSNDRPQAANNDSHYYEVQFVFRKEQKQSSQADSPWDEDVQVGGESMVYAKSCFNSNSAEKRHFAFQNQNSEENVITISFGAPSAYGVVPLVQETHDGDDEETSAAVSSRLELLEDWQRSREEDVAYHLSRRRKSSMAQAYGSVEFYYAAPVDSTTNTHDTDGETVRQSNDSSNDHCVMYDVLLGTRSTRVKTPDTTSRLQRAEFLGSKEPLKAKRLEVVIMTAYPQKEEVSKYTEISAPRHIQVSGG